MVAYANSRRSLKVLIAEYVPSLNKGELAILLGILENFKILDINTITFVFSFFPSIDEKRYPDNVKLINLTDELKIRNPFMTKSPISRLKIYLLAALQHLFFALGYTILRGRIQKIINKDIWKNYLEADLIVICHDQVNCVYGFGLIFSPIYITFLAKILKKPIMIYASGIHPFKRTFEKILASYVLNNVDLITVRDEESYLFLQKIVWDKNKLFFTYDPAILMRPVCDNKIDEILSAEGINKSNDSLLIGVDLSFEVLAKAFSGKISAVESFKKAAERIAKTLDKLIENFNAFIIFLPHCIEPYYLRDDRLIAKIIYNKIKIKDRVKIITKEYSAEELKGIISRLDLLITSRVHASISALSAGIPACVITHPSDRRAYGLLKVLAQDKWIFDVRNISTEHLFNHLKELILKSNEIRNNLQKSIFYAKRRAILNGILIKILLKEFYEKR